MISFYRSIIVIYIYVSAVTQTCNFKNNEISRGPASGVSKKHRYSSE